MKKVGFIGLGSLGQPMATRLVKAGYAVTVCGHRRMEPVEELKKLGATAVKTNKEVAQASDIVITMVVDDEQTADVLWGRDGLAEGFKSGSLLVLSSTLSREFCRKVSSEMAKQGVAVIDAPVAAFPSDIEGGTAVFMAGGSEADVATGRPVLEAMGAKAVFHFGPVGSGQAAKYIVEAQAIGAWFVAIESLRLGVAAGMDLHQLLKVLQVSGARSYMLEEWAHLSEVIKYCRSSPEAASGLQIIYRDIDLALHLAREVNAEVPITGLTRGLDILKMPTV